MTRHSAGNRIPTRASPETEAILEALEGFAGHKFEHRSGFAFLLEVSRTRQEIMDEIAFYAKFISNAHAILRRSGSAAEETARLSSEFGEKLNRTASLIRALLETAPAGPAEDFAARFLAPSHGSMERFLELLHELSWIKNYENEKKRSRRPPHPCNSL